MDTSRDIRPDDARADNPPDADHQATLEPAMMQHYWQQGTYPMELCLAEIARQTELAFTGYSIAAVDAGLERFFAVPYGTFKPVKH